MGTMMESISDSFSRISCWIAITVRTSSRFSTLRLSMKVVSLTYCRRLSSFSLPCACRFFANCAFHVAASARSASFRGCVDSESGPMLCTGASLSTRCSMDMYFMSSISNCSREGFLRDEVVVRLLKVLEVQEVVRLVRVQVVHHLFFSPFTEPVRTRAPA